MNDSHRAPDPRVDPETLAAFLDGRLSPEERARVMDVLAESEADYEAFLEAVHVRAALLEEPGDEAGESTGPEADETVRDRRGFPLRPLAAAAAVALLAAGAWFLSRAGAPAEQAPVALVASLDADPTAVPGWDTPAWPVVRSPDAVLTSRERAFRLGVRHAHLEAAVRADDGEASRRIADELASLASPLPGGGPLGALYRRIAEPPPEDEATVDLRREAWRALEHAAPTAELRLGAWVGAARLALGSDDRPWFRSPAARDASERLDAEALRPAVREAWSEVRDLARAEPLELEALASALDRLAAAAGGGRSAGPDGR